MDSLGPAPAAEVVVSALVLEVIVPPPNSELVVLIVVGGGGFPVLEVSSVPDSFPSGVSLPFDMF